MHVQHDRRRPLLQVRQARLLPWLLKAFAVILVISAARADFPAGQAPNRPTETPSLEAVAASPTEEPSNSSPPGAPHLDQWNPDRSARHLSQATQDIAGIQEHPQTLTEKTANSQRPEKEDQVSASAAAGQKSAHFGGTTDGSQNQTSVSNNVSAYRRQQADHRRQSKQGKLQRDQIEAAARRHKRQGPDICGAGWTMKSGSCYRTTSQQLSWSAARQACYSLNGVLTDIGSRSEENAIYDFLNSLGVPRAWIGLNDQQSEGRWLWSSGQAVTYLNWGNGEPNDADGSEDCVEILAQSRSGWNDNVCSTLFTGVCKKAIGNQCGELLRNSGVIRSPGFPGTYPNSLNCTLTLQAAPEHDVLFLQIRAFSTEQCCDHLRISDNNGLSLSFSGTRGPQNITLGSRAVLSFTTDETEALSGYELEFISMKRTDFGLCGVGWTMKSGSCYRVTPQMSWSDARQTCNSLNGVLADISSRAEENDIYGFLNSIGINRAWTGLNDRMIEGRWLWDSGKSLTYVNWGSGEPNDVVGSEDCVEILAQSRGGWNDNVCNKSFSGVCKKTIGSQCGELLRNSGVIRSLGFPGTYPSSANCTLSLQAAPEHDMLLLQFRAFSTEECCDHLRISDNNGLELSFSGTQVPQNITLGSRAVLSFTTDETEELSGYELEFISMKRSDYGICGVGWTMKSGSCYRVTSQMSWGDARQACNSLNGVLADISSRAEENDIYDFLNLIGINRAWIGLNDRMIEGRWLWDTGKPLTYVNWGTGEPNDVNGSEDCVEILAQSRGGWNDNVCNKSFSGVCKKTIGNADSCGGHFKGPGVILSPKFPNPIRAGVNCRWTVEAANGNTSLLLEFKSFSLDECCDEILISDGSEFQLTLSGNMQPQDLLLRAPIEITLVSKNASHIKSNAGFNITVTEVAGKAPRICRSGPWAMHGELCLAVLWYLPHRSWYEARLACRSMGGILVEPDDDEKLQSVGEYLAFHAPHTEDVWIGLKGNQDENLWQWDTGRQMTYSSWAAEQPHDVGNNASCVSLTIQGLDGAWTKDDCDASKAPMCTLMPRIGY